MTSSLEQLTDESREVALLVHSAQERAEDRELVKNAHLAVERLSQHYRELCNTGAQGERDAIERTGDQASAGPSEVQERRITGVSWRTDGPAGSALPPAVRVGGEIDAW